MTDGNKKEVNRKRGRAALVLLLILGVFAGIWLALGASAQAPDYAGLNFEDGGSADGETVIRASALSYLVYGCEQSTYFEGTVAELLVRGDMGIISENFGIVRMDADDPATAVFDSAELIRASAGEMRCVTSSRDAKSGFFGAAFADDEARQVWVVYAGAVTLADYRACAGLVLPSFTAQEKAAFAFFDAVLAGAEVKDGYRVLLAGHSLGGALAAEVAMASGCPAVTVNGADGLACDKLARMAGGERKGGRIENFVTVPDGFSRMERIQRLMLLGSGEGVTTHYFEKSGYTTDTHCAFSFLRFADEGMTAPVLPEER